MFVHTGDTAVVEEVLHAGAPVIQRLRYAASPTCFAGAQAEYPWRFSPLAKLAAYGSRAL